MKSFRFYIRNEDIKSKPDKIAILFTILYFIGGILIFYLLGTIRENLNIFLSILASYYGFLIFLFKKIKGAPISPIFFIVFYSMIIIYYFFSQSWFVQIFI